MYVVLVEVCKGSLIEVVIGMSIIHSLGVMATNSATAVERHIMTVDQVYDDELGHQATGIKGRTVSISGAGGGMQRRTGGGYIGEEEDSSWCAYERLVFRWHKNLK